MFAGIFPQSVDSTLADTPEHFVFVLVYITVVSILLTNFLLAIVIANYEACVAAVDLSVVEQDVWSDVVNIPTRILVWKVSRWPRQKVIIRYLQENVVGVGGTRLTPAMLSSEAGPFEDEVEAATFMIYYGTRIKSLVASYEEESREIDVFQHLIHNRLALLPQYGRKSAVFGVP